MINITNPDLQKRQAEFEKDYAQSELFKDKVAQLNPNKLTKKENKIRNKILNGKNISNEEFQTIFIYISDYDQAEAKLKPDIVVEAKKTERKILQTEEELLEFLAADSLEFKFAPCNIQGQQIELTIKAHPISDSAIIKTIEEHESLFKDYTADQFELINKNARGEVLTRAEQQILNDITSELADTEDSYESRFKAIKEFIASTCTIVFPNGNEIPFSIEYLNKFRFNDVVSLYIKLQHDLGISEDKNKELFPAC